MLIFPYIKHGRQIFILQSFFNKSVVVKTLIKNISVY